MKMTRVQHPEAGRVDQCSIEHATWYVIFVSLHLAAFEFHLSTKT